MPNSLRTAKIGFRDGLLDRTTHFRSTSSFRVAYACTAIGPLPVVSNAHRNVFSGEVASIIRAVESFAGKEVCQCSPPIQKEQLPVQPPVSALVRQTQDDSSMPSAQDQRPPQLRDNELACHQTL